MAPLDVEARRQKQGRGQAVWQDGLTTMLSTNRWEGGSERRAAATAGHRATARNMSSHEAEGGAASSTDARR